MNPFIQQSIHSLIPLLAEGKLSSVELAEAYLEQIDRFESELNTFIHIDPKMVISKARRADQERARENNTKPLRGIPIAVKDLITVKDMPCTAGSKILEGYIPPYSATVVRRLEEAGMIVIGKTNTDAFGMGSSTEFSDYGMTKNPWNLEHVPGGSSGGSAAAVAARLAPIALGTDTGGSVRQPASNCGVSGLKPSYGRVSRYGLIAFGSSLDVCGIFGRDIDDIWPIFSTIAGYDQLDMTTSKLGVPSIDQVNLDLTGLRIGISSEFFPENLQPEIKLALDELIRQLKSLGARIVEVGLAHIHLSVPVYYILAPAEASANLARFDGIRFGPRAENEKMWDVFFNTRSQKFGDEVKRRIMIGTYALSSGYYDAYYGQANKARNLIKQDFQQAFENVDIIFTPVAPTTALKIGAHHDDPLAMYLEDIMTLPPSLAGLPALSIPAGLDGQGLPIGAQLIGNVFQEDRLYQIAKVIQSVTTFHKMVPPLISSDFKGKAQK